MSKMNSQAVWVQTVPSVFNTLKAKGALPTCQEMLDRLMKRNSSFSRTICAFFTMRNTKYTSASTGRRAASDLASGSFLGCASRALAQTVPKNAHYCSHKTPHLCPKLCPPLDFTWKCYCVCVCPVCWNMRHVPLR